MVGFIGVAEALGVPEYLLSFFVGSIGTSLPELSVGISAIRQGRHDIAIGDLFGATLADATLSVGIGPLSAPTAITASLAVPGGIGATLAVAIATLLVSFRRKVDRLAGFLLLILYAYVYLVILAD